MNVAVIGAGSWGSAVAWLLGNKGCDVRLWARDDELVASFNANHRNPRYITDANMPDCVVATTSLEDAFGFCDGKTSSQRADAVVLATPSHAVRDMAKRMTEFIGADAPGASMPLVILSKGAERDTGELLLDVLADVLGNSSRLAVLSGPNHAEEVSKGVLSATVIASNDDSIAAMFQQTFQAKTFRVYTSTDTIGVQLCGAAKNIIAIAAGVAVGRGYGDNTLAMLMTRGLAEIARLVTACGGQGQTCMGLAGMGDLIATCTSAHSRNRSYGQALAKTGETVASYQERTHMVVEGAYAARSITKLAREHDVEMPIAEQVLRAVWDGGDVDAMIAGLLGRPAKPEFY
ncbi:MAG: NAD(P)-dependent glycerol-3-phosphate dehydrogenase [Coriobacteriales bacterium]|jgi:glycerol-3-phosphate dehydrogenase (NAD(P)+)|nr:NAD(P)-dependent glycerol-3-phosphate dehydrogenase [Coriobacteriales bacterium]